MSSPDGSSSSASRFRGEAALGIVWKADRVLIARRPAHKFLGGLWEFPGGKPEPGETLAGCAEREVREELGIEIAAIDPWPPISFDYPDRTVTLYPFTCRWISGEPQALGCQEWRWAWTEELSEYEFPPGSAPILAALARGEGRLARE